MTVQTSHCNSTRPTNWWILSVVAVGLSSVFAVTARGASAGQETSAPVAAQDGQQNASPEGAASDSTDASGTSETPTPPSQSKPVWPESEIADARAHCAVVLQRIHAVAMPFPPMREGPCGAPAPIELFSIGQNPEVAISPPAIVRCDLAEELVHWLEHDLQPLALKHLKSKIIRINTMSSYSCRNAYGRKSTKLSEHGRANALDIGGFVMASAKTAGVLADWGKPEREIAAEATEKKAAEEAAAKAAAASSVAQPAPNLLPPTAPSTAASVVAGLARSTLIEGAPNSTDVSKLRSTPEASRLGGPPAIPAVPRKTPKLKAAFAADSGDDNPDPEMKAFLHEAHTAACRIFATTLGPEANAAHRNHFHVDMAPRKFTKICD